MQTPTLFDTLNDHQIEAVKAEQKRILVLAGACSGKFKNLILYFAKK